VVPIDPDAAARQGNCMARKRVNTAVAECALHGIVAVPSRDDRGRPTLVLSRGGWTREVAIERLAEALAEARQLAAAGRLGETP